MSNKEAEFKMWQKGQVVSNKEAEFKQWQKGQAVGMVCAGMAGLAMAWAFPEMSLKHYSVVCALVGAIYRFRL